MAEPEGSLNIPTDSGSLQHSFQEGAKEAEQVRRHQHTSQHNLNLNILFFFTSQIRFFVSSQAPSGCREGRSHHECEPPASRVEVDIVDEKCVMRSSFFLFFSIRTV